MHERLRSHAQAPATCSARSEAPARYASPIGPLQISSLFREFTMDELHEYGGWLLADAAGESKGRRRSSPPLFSMAIGPACMLRGSGWERGRVVASPGIHSPAHGPAAAAAARRHETTAS